jgi:hypothetical protein
MAFCTSIMSKAAALNFDTLVLARLLVAWAARRSQGRVIDDSTVRAHIGTGMWQWSMRVLDRGPEGELESRL